MKLVFEKREELTFNVESFVKENYFDNETTNSEITKAVSSFFDGLDDEYYYSNNKNELKELVCNSILDYLKNNVIEYDAKKLWEELLDNDECYAVPNSSKRRIMLNWLENKENN